MQRKRQYKIWWFAVAIFLVALLLRIIYLASRWPILPDWNVDAIGYHQLAVNLNERGVFSLNSEPPFQPDAIRTPAYPLLIALIYRFLGVMPHAVLIVQSILDALTALLVMGIALNLKQPNRVAVVAGTMYAFYPAAWHYCAEFYVEIFLAFAIALIFWGVSILQKAEVPNKFSSYIVFGLGVASGLALLIKPTAILLPIILGMVLLIKRKFRYTLSFMLALGIMLAPWIIRNLLVFGRPILSTAFENNLARVSAPATLAEARGENVAPWTLRWEALFLEVVEIAARNNPALFATQINDMTPRQIDRVQIELAKASRAIIIAHPIAFITSHAKGTLRGLLPREEYRFWFQRLSGQTWESAMPSGMVNLVRNGGWRVVPPLALILFVIFLMIYALGFVTVLAGIWHLSRYDKTVAVTMAAVIAYMIILPGPIAYERFQVPVMPLVFVLMGCGYVAYTQYLRKVTSGPPPD